MQLVSHDFTPSLAHDITHFVAHDIMQSVTYNINEGVVHGFVIIVYFLLELELQHQQLKIWSAIHDF